MSIEDETGRKASEVRMRKALLAKLGVAVSFPAIVEEGGGEK